MSTAKPTAESTAKYTDESLSEESRSRHPLHDSNISLPERWMSVAGSGLLAYAASRSGWLGRILLGGAGTMLFYRGVTGHSAAYRRIGGNSTANGHHPTSIEVDEAVTVYGKTPEQAYDFWRDFEAFPRFMHHLESVEQISDERSRWTARVPKKLGTIRWEAEITEDEPGKRIGWRSMPDADIENAGAVNFAESSREDGTEVRVQLSYHVPGGKAGALLGQLLNPGNRQLIRNDVRRFKHLLEAGEVPRIEGQPTGKGRK